MKKMVFFGLIIFIILICVLGLLLGAESNVSKGLSEVSQSTESQVTRNVEMELALSQEQFNRREQVIDSDFTDKDIADINEWYSKSIHHPHFAGSDYDSYDEDTLVTMINAGDVMAMKALWARYLREDDPLFIEKQYDLVERAVIYGDREMFPFMQTASDLKTTLGNPNLTEKQRKDVAIEYLALTEFVGMRGQLEMKYSDQKFLFNFYPKIYSNAGDKLTLTADDKLKIRAKAKDIYQYYEQMRIGVGLGTFDNSIPEGVQKLFDRQKEPYLKLLGDNAI